VPDELPEACPDDPKELPELDELNPEDPRPEDPRPEDP
jgi:hypothetical protein